MEKINGFLKRHLNSGEVIKGFLGMKKKAPEEFEHPHFKSVLRKPAQIRRGRGFLREYLSKAGINVESGKVSLWVFRFAIFVNLLLSAYLIYRFSTDLEVNAIYVTVVMIVMWIFAFVTILFLVWFSIFVLLDLRIFKRRVGIEEVLPDYLHLTSANIRAGMTLDKALWYAVRPRFGVLAKEIEVVAKETMSGEDLETAMKRFADKYDSVTLKRAINLLIESYRAGGEIGDILTKIADNIKENQLMRKEMSANVTTYAIFITFATMIAAPILFALSEQFLSVINKILGNIDIDEVRNLGTGFSFMFTSTGVSVTDFRIFAIISLLLSSLFSACIVATIRKGSVKSGISYIPVFMITTVSLYLVWSFVFSILMGSLL